MSFLIGNELEFVHIPKTAGCWIEHCCRGYIKVLGNRHDLGRHSSRYAFAVARNPLSWLESAFYYIRPRLNIASVKLSKKRKFNWFPVSQFQEIGQLEALSDRKAIVDDFIKEYLKRCPGTYSKAAITYYEQVDRLISFEDLRPQLFHLFNRKLKSHQAKVICPRVMESEATNVSPRPAKKHADERLLARIIEADREWYDYVQRRTT